MISYKLIHQGWLEVKQYPNSSQQQDEDCEDEHLNWFVLTNCHEQKNTLLSCYEDKKMEKCKQQFVLSCHCTLHFETNEEEMKYKLIIKTTSSTIELIAPNSIRRSEWLSAIERCIEMMSKTDDDDSDSNSDDMLLTDCEGHF